MADPVGTCQSKSHQSVSCPFGDACIENVVFQQGRSNLFLLVHWGYLVS